jgi:hypothetical protein
MTFLQCQDRVLDITNGSSTTARTRVKRSLNLRYGQVQTGVNLMRLRRAIKNVELAVGDGDTTITNTSRVSSVYDPQMRRVLLETTMEEIRRMDPGGDREGDPTHYVVFDQGSGTITIYFWPLTDRTRTVAGSDALKADVIAAPTDLSADGDVPAMPVDYHDVLIYGALADEWMHLQKFQLAKHNEGMFEKRLSELRYYVVKSNTQSMTQGAWETESMARGHVFPLA